MPYLLLGKPCFDIYAHTLEKYNFTPIAMPCENRVNATVSTHADTLIFAHGGEFVANKDYVRTLPSFIRKYFTAAEDFPHGTYPTDTPFNALVLHSCIFARLDTLSSTVLDIAKAHGLAPVNVRQGYARCSTLALGAANAALSADEGMARAMEAHGVEVLRIDAGHIALGGCEYGFIGGASFVDEAHQRVFFFGHLSSHPDSERIEAFLARHEYIPVSLGGTLTDFGGAVIIE